MRTAKCAIGRMATAFGLGVLLAMVCPSEWVLIVTLVVMILLAVCSTNRMRG